MTAPHFSQSSCCPLQWPKASASLFHTVSAYSKQLRSLLLLCLPKALKTCLFTVQSLFLITSIGLVPGESKASAFVSGGCGGQTTCREKWHFLFLQRTWVELPADMGSQLTITPVLGIQHLLLEVWVPGTHTVYIHMCKQNTYMHTMKIN